MCWVASETFSEDFAAPLVRNKALSHGVTLTLGFRPRKIGNYTSPLFCMQAVVEDKRMRMMSAAFHHFPPPMARQLLLAAVESESAIMIVDGGSSRVFNVFLPVFHIFQFPGSLVYFLNPWRVTNFIFSLQSA